MGAPRMGVVRDLWGRRPEREGRGAEGKLKGNEGEL